nr:LOW QUALITY PROTEIN: ornithine decarboxylase antizyme 3 [Pogona vitticeps]
MTPSDKSSTHVQQESLSFRPRYCLQCSEFEGGCPDRRRNEGEDGAGLKEVYKAGKLTVFASDCQHPDHPVQLDFHFARGSQGSNHWHGLLRGRDLFLDTPCHILDLNSRDSLVATLEYTEEKTEADRVIVNFRKSRQDRRDLLRAFGFLGFNLLRPDDPTLPPWEDAIFMVYPMDRSLCLEEE